MTEAPSRPSAAVSRRALAGRRLAVPLLAAVLVACGAPDPETVPADTPTTEDPSQMPPTDTPTTDPPPTDTPATGTPATGQTVLQVTVDDGTGTISTHTLTCEPPGGDVPDPPAACAAVAQAGRSGFAPLPADAMCTMVFGGPQQATVSGTIDGQPVAATFRRTNGCEISRWDALAPLLGRYATDT